MNELFDPTPKQRANLAKLANYLAALPFGYEGFNMKVYSGEWIDRATGRAMDSVKVHEAAPECGACACAIGHGPLAGIPIAPEDTHWSDFARRVFGTSETGSRAGRFMFGMHNPNDPHAAAQRIRAVLSGDWPGAELA